MHKKYDLHLITQVFFYFKLQKFKPPKLQKQTKSSFNFGHGKLKLKY